MFALFLLQHTTEKSQTEPETEISGESLHAFANRELVAMSPVSQKLYQSKLLGYSALSFIAIRKCILTSKYSKEVLNL